MFFLFNTSGIGGPRNNMGYMNGVDNLMPFGLGLPTNKITILFPVH